MSPSRRQAVNFEMCIHFGAVKVSIPSIFIRLLPDPGRSLGMRLSILCIVGHHLDINRRYPGKILGCLEDLQMAWMNMCMRHVLEQSWDILDNPLDRMEEYVNLCMRHVLEQSWDILDNPLDRMEEYVNLCMRHVLLRWVKAGSKCIVRDTEVCEGITIIRRRFITIYGDRMAAV